MDQCKQQRRHQNDCIRYKEASGHYRSQDCKEKASLPSDHWALDSIFIRVKQWEEDSQLIPNVCVINNRIAEITEKRGVWISVPSRLIFQLPLVDQKSPSLPLERSHSREYHWRLWHEFPVFGTKGLRNIKPIKDREDLQDCRNKPQNHHWYIPTIHFTLQYLL